MIGTIISVVAAILSVGGCIGTYIQIAKELHQDTPANPS